MRIAKAVAVLAVVCALVFLVSRRADSQQSQIREAINPAKVVVLKGNVHPWAQARFDRGLAPASLPMQRMMLVLKSTPEQGAQLDELLREQQDRNSVNYHKWLTPEEFGSRFGASEADIQTITAWLESQGFRIDLVAKGRNLIEFSGNAGKVMATFHATMHSYVIGGQQYWANANDPSIPEALVPAVAGIASLNNFPRKPATRFAGNFTRTKAGRLIRKAATKPANPEFTYAGGCNGSGTNCYAVTPYDFATIYNVLPLWTASTPINGTGQTIAIVSDSDINKSDFTNFRSLFGLPAGTLNQLINGTDPGVLGGASCTSGDCNESEADVDTEWAGAVAPGATIDLVVSQSTNTSFGGDLSAEAIIDHDTISGTTINASVLGYSYGLCEFFLGSGGNAFYGGTQVKDTTGEWAQAATEGIAVVVSTGDNGSTGCDSPQGINGAAPSDQPATFGLAVSGIASTPYNVAVGGTDFNDGTVAEANSFWNSSNSSTTQQSVKGYIPEIVYNSSCMNAPLDALYDASATTDGLTNCNTFFTTSSLGLGPLVVPFGGGGGPSTCINSNYNGSNDTGTFAGCTQGYAKPSWQTGNGVPSDGVRDLPDVAIFAGDGTFQNFYLFCQQDADATSTTPCSLSAGTSNNFPDIQGVGGTSVSAEVFVGMMALLNQAEGASGPVGLPNKNLYALAAQSWANCQSSGTLNSGCIFYQITSGSNAMPCVSATTKYGTPPGCSQGSGSSVGVTEANGSQAYQAAAGYNLATGLGSLNVYNLVKEWNVGSGGAADFVLSASPAAVNVAAAGQTGTTTITVVPVNGFSDTVNVSASSCAGLPTGATCSFSSSPVSANGTTMLTIQTSAAAAVPPAAQPNEPGAWRTPGIVALGGVLGIAILFFTLHGRNRRLGVAAACIIFAAFLGIAGCSSSPSSNPPPPPPPGPAAVVPVAVTITGTSTAGQVSHSTTIMLTVQ